MPAPAIQNLPNMLMCCAAPVPVECAIVRSMLMMCSLSAQVRQ